VTSINLDATFTSVTTWFTAVVDGTSFPAQNSEVTGIITNEQPTTVYESYTFPGLTVTSLTPGEAITMVIRTSYE
jgi:hypothetical protein